MKGSVELCKWGLGTEIPGNKPCIFKVWLGTLKNCMQEELERNRTIWIITEMPCCQKIWVMNGVRRGRLVLMQRLLGSWCHQFYWMCQQVYGVNVLNREKYVSMICHRLKNFSSVSNASKTLFLYFHVCLTSFSRCFAPARAFWWE